MNIFIMGRFISFKVYTLWSAVRYGNSVTWDNALVGLLPHGYIQIFPVDLRIYILAKELFVRTNFIETINHTSISPLYTDFISSIQCHNNSKSGLKTAGKTVG